jgi:hypothetical protein
MDGGAMMANEKKHTRKSVAYDIGRIRNNITVRSDKIAKLQEQNVIDNAKIKELETIRNSLNAAELMNKFSDSYNSVELTDEQMGQFVEICKPLLAQMANIDAEAVIAMIMSGEVNTKPQKKSAKVETPSPKAVEIEPPAPQEDIVENDEDDTGDTLTSSNLQE